MRKMILGVLLAVTAALAAGLPAAADTVGDATPACADIVDGTAVYDVPATDSDPTTHGPATVTGSFNVNDDIANCPNVTYAMWVSWQRDGKTFFRVDTSPEPSILATNTGTFSQVVPAGIPSVFVGFTTSSGFTIIDRAPNAFSPPSTGGVQVFENAGSPGGGTPW